MESKLSDYYKQGVIGAVSEFEKTAVFQQFMKDDSFKEEFLKRITQKIEERKSESNLGG